MPKRVKSLGRMGLVLLVMAATVCGRAEGPAARPNIVVVRAVVWPQLDPARQGAAELAILMQVVRLRREYAQSGLIAVGDRRGRFSAGEEEALCRAVLQGVPVVKLAGGHPVMPAAHGLFLDGGNLSEEEARQLLGRCLEKYGALPAVGRSAAGDPATPELRARLQLFQQEFAVATSPRLAAR